MLLSIPQIVSEIVVNSDLETVSYVRKQTLFTLYSIIPTFFLKN
jgi:hypothetical protein